MTNAWAIDKDKTYYFSCTLTGGSPTFELNTYANTYSATAVTTTSAKDETTGLTTIEGVFTPSDVLTSIENVTDLYFVGNFAWMPNQSLYDFELCEVAVADDEYSEGDTYTDTDNHTYNVVSGNMVVNGGFNMVSDGVVTGWTAGNGYTDALKAGGSGQVTITSTGGFNSGAYLTCPAKNGNTDYTATGSAGSPSQAIKVEGGKMYLFIGHAGGTTPSDAKYQGLYKMTDATTEGDEIVNLKWTAGTGEDWTTTEYVFVATTDYVGIRCSWCPSASFDGFQLYEIEQTDCEASDLTEPLEEAKAALVNVANDDSEDNAFKIPTTTAEVAAVNTAISAAEELANDADGETIYAAILALRTSAYAFTAGFDTYALTEPDEGNRYKITLKNSDKSWNNTPATFHGNEVSFGQADKEYNGQAFIFTPVDDTLNGYTISYTGTDGETYYLGLGKDIISGGDSKQIRTTTDASLAFTFVISADATTENIWHIYNSEAKAYVGNNNNGSGFYTDNSATNIEFTLAEEATVTYDFANGYAAAMLPFAAELPEGMKAYPSFATTTADDECSIVLSGAVDKITANTPYILKYSVDTDDDPDAETTVTFKGYGTYYGDDTTVTSDLLTGTFEEIEKVTAGLYVLQSQTDDQGDDVFAFYPVGEDDETSLEAYNCYLTYTAAEGETAPSVIVFSTLLTDLAEAIEEAEATLASLANVGDQAFQIPTSYVESVNEALTAAQAITDESSSDEIQAATDALNEALEDLANAKLNEPAPGTFHIIMLDTDPSIAENGEDPAVVQGKAVQFSTNSSTEGGYSLQFTAVPNNNRPDQVFTFTPVEYEEDDENALVNAYTISFGDENKTFHYLCTNKALSSSGSTSQIRTSTVEDSALVVVVKVTTTEGCWKLYNTEAGYNLGINKGVDHNHALFTNEDDTKSDLALVNADTIEWTLQDEYGTLVLPFAPTEDEIDGLTFYSTNAYETGDTLKLAEVAAEDITENTPYIVSGTEDTYKFRVTERTFNTYSNTSGWLTGVYESTTVDKTNYVLQNQEDEDGLAFYLVNTGDITLEPNHCYLTVSSSESDAPAVVYFPNGNSATAITGVEANNADAEAIYDLSGRKVSNATTGIYIKGGKKVVIK
ncbi:MAG: hypothetical protein LUC44_08770 [Prevotellaceae bacterium]|nr:hypothetical protein [Prevotellaceae bacterium]